MTKSVTASRTEVITSEKLEKVLYKVNKPSRYIGNEPGSVNKDWESAQTRTALAFPDLYEIGISNLGLRILYNRINGYEGKNFLADRVYAPETDFRDELKAANLPLYGLESKQPLKNFDLIAFSLQYELSYPTLLSMLEQADIPYRSSERTDADPFVIAGGPGCYNPEPVADYIDAFIIGDGETVIIEILETILDGRKSGLGRQEILVNLASLQGIYVPIFYEQDKPFSKPTLKGHPELVSGSVPEKIDKRIDEVDNTNYPVEFPVPFSSAVHDRAVVEIRRGCGRMCRFCQPCFVNFPIRERSPENIISLVDKTLENTGYEEYSLLSLSSNDYGNIESLVKVLNDKHSKNGTSISLPSQRADKFSLELAELVQAVRKSTITIAPEAGTQRLRNVINKNLTEEQILDAVLSVYKAGWQSIKLYFMVGLPTETYEDIDGIHELLRTIQYRARLLRKELGLNRHLNITCSMSIFVPKPFTPFQWVGQENHDVLYEKIKYLREKAKTLKGVRLNFHDIFLCRLEAAFSRGDRRLNVLIEEVHKQGSYLDAWKEHFNKQIWLDSAEKLGINIEEFSEKQFTTYDELPWDIINVGVNHDWLVKEYENAISAINSVPCEEACSNCGVCSEFKTKPSLKSRKLPAPAEQKEPAKIFSETGYKYRLKMAKTGALRFISHLDWQKLIYTAIKKSGLKINYSQGFNPSPKISVGIAIPLFVEGENEYVDIELQHDISEIEIKEKLNKILPKTSQVNDIVKIPKGQKSIQNDVYWAKYRAVCENAEAIKKINIETIAKELLLKENIHIEKRTKKGIKQIDIKPGIHSLSYNQETQVLEFTLKTGGGCIIKGDSEESLPTQDITVLTDKKTSISSVRADEFVKLLTPELDWRITREQLLDYQFNEL